MIDAARHPALEIRDVSTSCSHRGGEIIAALCEAQASIAPKYFYDAQGSALFERITRLPEYYPTRTEHSIMAAHGREIGGRIAAGATTDICAPAIATSSRPRRAGSFPASAWPGTRPRTTSADDINPVKAIGGVKMKIDCDDFRVLPEKTVDLAKRPTTIKPLYKSRKHYAASIEQHIAELTAQQSLLYANNSHPLLLIFQAMDAAGKDSAIKHVMSGVNPQGCQVVSFKHPSAAELARLDGLHRRRWQARLDRCIGYYEPYATSHEALDRDQPLQEESRNAARAVAKAVVELGAGRLQAVQPDLSRPRPK